MKPATSLPAPTQDTIAYELHGNLYLNITNRCTLRCAFCPKFNHQWDVQSYNLRLRREPSVAELIAAVGDPKRYREIVFCGLGESTLRLDTLVSVAEYLHARGARIRLNTDGLANLVYGRDVTTELAHCVDAVSISLNAQDAATYERHCRPKHEHAFEAVLEFIERAREHIADVTLTAIDGLEGVDIEACEALAKGLGVKFRRRVLDRVG